MTTDQERIRELRQEGYCCAQVMVAMGLEKLGEENPQMIEAVSPLCAGARSGLLCGAVSGACIMFGLYDKQLANQKMVPEFMAHIKEEFDETYGGTDCLCILKGDMQNRFQTCPSLIERVYEIAAQVLEANGF